MLKLLQKLLFRSKTGRFGYEGIHNKKNSLHFTILYNKGTNAAKAHQKVYVIYGQNALSNSLAFFVLRMTM